MDNIAKKIVELIRESSDPVLQDFIDLGLEKCVA
jgi:hypothetical protein